MTTLPAEIHVAIINAVTSDTLPGAYTYSSDVKATLRNLGLVNFAWHEWSTGLLYHRVTVTDDQIAKLRDTLSPSTPRAITLAKRVHSLRLRAADVDSNASMDPPDVSTEEDVAQATALLRILGPHGNLQRLFMDMALTVETLRLQNAIGSLTTLSELVLGNRENNDQYFFWTIELAQRRFDCLSTLRSVTILDVNIGHPETGDVLSQLTNVKEFVVIRPWNSDGGRLLSELFAFPGALQKLTIIMASGWKDWNLPFLKAEDLDPTMIPYTDKLLILPDNRSQPLLSWEAIRDMIGVGHRWETGLEG